MNSIIVKALASMESMDVTVQAGPATSEAPAAAAPNPAPGVASPDGMSPEARKATVIMDGPLSNIYFKALNIALAKPDPVTGVPATESLALANYYTAASLKAAGEKPPAQADDVVNVYATGTVLRAPAEEDVIPVVRQLESVGIPGDFIIVDKAMKPTDDAPVGGASVGVVEMDKRASISAEDIEGFSVVIRLKSKKA